MRKLFLVELWTERSDWSLKFSHTTIIILFADQSEVVALPAGCKRVKDGAEGFLYVEIFSASFNRLLTNDTSSAWNGDVFTEHHWCVGVPLQIFVTQCVTLFTWSELRTGFG